MRLRHFRKSLCGRIFLAEGVCRKVEVLIQRCSLRAAGRWATVATVIGRIEQDLHDDRNNQIVAGIILEGVTGAGKTQTLAALIRHPEFPVLLGSGRVFDEDETFGEVMTEMQEPGISRQQHVRRLEHVLARIERDAGRFRHRAGFVLERFHLSYYALLPDWNLYAEFDERLARLNFLTVLLQIPEQDLAHRCLDREDREGTTWSADMITHYGSRRAVLEAIVQSTSRRREAAHKSRLPVFEIDTGSKLWEAYADKVVEAWHALMGNH